MQVGDFSRSVACASLANDQSKYTFLLSRLNSLNPSIETMDNIGAGSRSSFRSSYGKLSNIYSSVAPLQSRESLNSLSAGPDSPDVAARSEKRLYTTMKSLHDPKLEKQLEDSGVEISQYTNAPSLQTGVACPGTFENPKPAIYTGFWANGNKIIPHVVAIVVTVAVVQLSFRNHYWMDLQDPSYEILPGLTQGGALNALQLAVKVHEIILVISLGRVVLHVAHEHLVGRAGLPLGLITNSFFIGAGEFLWTKAFWNSIWTTKNHYWRFWLLSLFATILAMLAGPSSAIAVIPSLDWYPLKAPLEGDALPFYIFNQSTVLWPSEVTAASVNAADSDVNCTRATTRTAYQNLCPAGGFRDTYSWAGNQLFVNSSAGSNISFTDTNGDSRRILTTQSCESDFDGRASGLSINTFISSAMTEYWTFARNNFHGIGMETARPKISFSGPLYAPRVEVMCNGYNYDSVSMLEGRGPISFPSFTSDRELPEPGYIFPYNGVFNDTRTTWVEMPRDPDDPAIGILARVPWTYSRSNDSQLVQTTEYHACSIYAQWVPVEVFYEPRQSDQISFRVKSKLTNTCLPIGHNDPDAQPPRNMTIDMGYANAINQPMPFVDEDTPAIDAMLQSVVFEDGELPDGTTGLVFRSPLNGVANTDGKVTTETAGDIRKSHSTMISTILVSRSSLGGKFYNFRSC